MPKKFLLPSVLLLIFCSTIYAQDCYPPILTNNPGYLTRNHCQYLSYKFESQPDPLDDSGNLITYSSNFGYFILKTGYWGYSPSIEDIGMPLDLIITLSNGICSQDYHISVIITNAVPEIINCPQEIVQCINNGYPLFTFKGNNADCDNSSYRFGSHYTPARYRSCQKKR